MIGRTAREALRSVKDEAQRRLTCVSDGVVIVSQEPGVPVGDRYALTFSQDPIRLAGHLRIGLHIAERYRLRSADPQPRRVEIGLSGYDYTLVTADKREILAFHWHPEGRSHVTEPHLHLSTASAPATLPELARAHLPTGSVELNALLRSLLRDFGVEPNRADWQRILADV